MRKIIFLICVSVVFLCVVNAQINTGVFPQGLQNKMERPAVSELKLDAPNLTMLKGKNVQNGKNGLPLYIAKNLEVNVSLENSGVWTTTNYGIDVWRLSISAQGALGCMLYFDKFDLPIGSSFFVYTPDGSLVFGPYTQQDNMYGSPFAIGMIYGEEAILEYSTHRKNLEIPTWQTTDLPTIELEAYGYVFRDAMDLRTTNNYGTSQNCEVNINCSEGDSWRKQQKGVARILSRDSRGSYYCSGSLVNNTLNDGTPYFLTADHCGGSAAANYLNQWIFYFNYESASCENEQPQNTALITGCVRKSRASLHGGSDFVLLELNTTPEKIAEIGGVYNGWDVSANTSSSGVCIHHPNGDVKKISTYAEELTTITYDADGYKGSAGGHWRTYWTETTNGHGITEGGSSGSPLFNTNGLVIGTLSGGLTYCSTPNLSDWFGKMSYHWDAAGGNATQQLKPWLDPLHTDTLSCALFDPNAILNVFPENILFSSAATTNQITINSGASSANWTVVSDQEWLAVSPDRGRGSSLSTEVLLTAAENNTDEERTAVVTVTHDSAVATIMITQQGKSSLDLDLLAANYSFELWNVGRPYAWLGEKTTIETDVYQTSDYNTGSYAIQLLNMASQHKVLSTQPLAVTNGKTYSISYWVKGQGDLRTGLYDSRASYNGCVYNDYRIINTTEYMNCIDFITAENTITNAEFLFSIKNTIPEQHLVLDDVIIVALDVERKNPEAAINGFGIYPNPSANYIQLAYDFLDTEDDTQLLVYDVSGRVVKKQLVNKENTTVFVRELPFGVYYVRLGDKVRKLIKN